MIEPAFLAALRRRHRAEPILLLVQLEQLVPGWWATLNDLAEQLGTERSTLNHSIRHLHHLELIAYASLSKGGTWIWWVKRHAADQPATTDEPAWKVKDLSNRTISRITITGRAKWAARHNIPYPTLRSFLSGHQLILRSRWRLVSSPHDTPIAS